MKFSIISFILTTFCIASQDTATVNFLNGDKLSGHAIALNLQTLTWQSDLLKNQAKFNLDQIKDLQLSFKLDNSSTQDASHEAVLELTNGNTVKGLLAGLNDQEIRLNTWYAGEMVFRRLNVKSITISRKNKLIYSGPNGLDGWKINGAENSWSYEVDSNELVSNGIGSIARDINFSEDVEIAYDLSWKGSLRSKMIVFTSDINTTTPKSGYEISFFGSYARIKHLSDDSFLIGKVNQNRMQQKNSNSARIVVRISSQSKKILVLIDDEILGTWTDNTMNEIKDKGLMFNADNNSVIKISNISVSEWDGLVDETDEDELNIQRFNMHRFQNGGFPVTPPKPQELPEGRMLLANGDSLEGEVLGIDKEMIKIKTPFAEVTFPVERINNIALKKADLETARLYQGDVRAVLADGSIFVFRLDDVKDGKLIGYSQNFGRAEFLQTAFKRIEFNIYPKFK